jgi:hypothetical protein
LDSAYQPGLGFTFTPDFSNNTQQTFDSWLLNNAVSCCSLVTTLRDWGNFSPRSNSPPAAPHVSHLDTGCRVLRVSPLESRLLLATLTHCTLGTTDNY